MLVFNLLWGQNAHKQILTHAAVIEDFLGFTRLNRFRFGPVGPMSQEDQLVSGGTLVVF